MTKQRPSGATKREAFQDWLKEPAHSSALLVHGNSDSTYFCSPLSYLYAQIAQTYAEQDGMVVISSHCSLHTQLRDRRAIAAALLRQLVGQLLSHKNLRARPFDLSLTETNQEDQNQDTFQLCKLSKELIGRLLPFNLFC
ncbi:uncharacterized protein Z518_07166 [Rhinocladiella mackenziei CBS 650.93]|uniref:Uncharacterized protein n=1 Tax=Rhinocladiella mackenziei CBS 650.93 TaxID=1442369 RepID=A0A0D2GZJ4_9EURO|nr:uncharacterized protein Z518_07166 [Rhinocladiella mackenziei CBS 650.93]KIX03613.1 hypothetical protein Z518_07166 [Rhinocladiella mackenziei CBS 650.93]